LDAVQIAVQVDLQQRRGMIGRPACRRRCHPRKTQARQVQFVDEDLDYPNRVLLADVILKAVRQQRWLHPIFAIDEPMHCQPPKPLGLRILRQLRPRRNPPTPQISPCFHTGWTLCRPSSQRKPRPLLPPYRSLMNPSARAAKAGTWTVRITA